MNEKKSNDATVCAFSGKRGAFAEQAVERCFGPNAFAMPVNSFREIFEKVSAGEVDCGMVPIENTLAGSVYENYDNLYDFDDVRIIAGVTLRVVHALLAPKGATLENIRTVYSHPQALYQCSRFLAKHKDWNKVECVSTATAAAEVAQNGSVNNAAIASAVNARYYGLDVLKDSIENDAANYTRFVVIASSARAGEGGETPFAKRDTSSPRETSFIFSVKNEPGALYNALGVFQAFKLNLTRLESRPVPGKPWCYRFYADAELAVRDEEADEFLKGVMTALRVQVAEVRLLGVYENRS